MNNQMTGEHLEKEMMVVNQLFILQIFVECLLGIFPGKKREDTKRNCDLYSMWKRKIWLIH